MKRLLLIVFGLLVASTAHAAFTGSTIWEVEPNGIDDFNTSTAAVSAGGTLYSAGDVLTIVGGSSTTSAAFVVTSTNAATGAVTGIAVNNFGHYTVLPTNPVSTTGGTGSLCTLTITWNSGGNGGGFDAGVAGFATDGAATSATGNAASFTSASYVFVSSDTGAAIYIKSGTAWFPGYYKITSVSAGAAIVNSTLGAWVSNYTLSPSTSTGMATTASPTSATWGLDYSWQASSYTGFGDLAIDAAVNTKVRSAAHPFGANAPGNIINITGGSGFTVQRVAIASVSVGTATVDKSLGTLGSTSGTGNMGGALASPGLASNLMVTLNLLNISSGTYSISSATVRVPGGEYGPNVAGGESLIMGYGKVWGDNILAPTLLVTTTSVTVMGGQPGFAFYENLILNGQNLTGSNGATVGNTGYFYNVTFSSFSGTGLAGASLVGSCVKCVFNYNTGTAVSGSAMSVMDSEAYNNTKTPFTNYSCIRDLAYNNSGASTDGFDSSFTSNSIAFGNGEDGFGGGADSTWINNISVANGRYGFSPRRDITVMLNDAVYNNVTKNLNQTALRVPQQYNNIVILSTTPFVNSGANNFGLNTLVGGGLGLRGVGIPGTYPVSPTIGYQDIGAAQHKDPTTGRAWLQ